MKISSTLEQLTRQRVGGMIGKWIASVNYPMKIGEIADSIFDNIKCQEQEFCVYGYDRIKAEYIYALKMSPGQRFLNNVWLKKHCFFWGRGRMMRRSGKKKAAPDLTSDLVLTGEEIMKDKIIRIAIVDDEEVFCNQVKKIVEKFFIPRAIAYEVKVYNLPMELLWDIEDNQYFDIYLMDIEMPGLGGMELAQTIRVKYDEPYIIFVTSYMEYCIKGYEYNAYRYITKNQVNEMLPLAFEGMLKKLKETTLRLYVIESYSKIIKIAHNDIFYLHVDGKYTCFYTKQGEFRERKALNKVLETLNSKAFIYTDKSYAVNLRHVLTLGERAVAVRTNDGETIVPVSIPQFQKVKKAISDFWRGKL